MHMQDLGITSWSDIRDLGKYCPNLEVLNLPAVLLHNTAPWRDDCGHMHALPRLRECVIHRIVPLLRTPPIIFSSSDIEHVIGWLFRGMPALETFTFGHGRCWGIVPSQTLETLERQLPETPAELENCPSSLRNLHLKDFRVSKKSSMLFYFYTDQLETITLTGCAGDPSGSLESILPKCGPEASIKHDGNSICLRMN